MKDEIKKSEAFVALQKIKETEEKARRIINKAREKETSRIIQNAYDEAKDIKKSSLKWAREETEERKKAIIQKATKEAERIRREAEAEGKELHTKAEKLVQEAVEKVTEKIKDFLKGGLL